jgi:hypothetical protein
MIVKFPTECSDCPYFKSWESGIMEIICRCEFHEIECDADMHIFIDCEGGGL